jgi:hypothetical protein
MPPPKEKSIFLNRHQVVQVLLGVSLFVLGGPCQHPQLGQIGRRIRQRGDVGALENRAALVLVGRLEEDGDLEPI